MKIFGVGLNRTGTTTLGACLRELGYRHAPYRFDLLRSLEAGRLDEIFSFCEPYDSFEDWPWPLIYREMDAQFPGSKFILTTRRDSGTWIDSLKKHAAYTGPTYYRRIAYGHEMPGGHEVEHIGLYEKHNAAVRDFFRGRDADFLELCWEKGSGWSELCAFLGRETPVSPLPHLNSSALRAEPEIRPAILRRLLRRFSRV